MEKDKSPIISTTVSMGIAPKNDVSTPISVTKPWVVLINGDFGFKYSTPEKISSSQWNDFFSAHTFECACTVDKKLPAGMQPFFLEYTIGTLQDFSPGNIIEKAPVLNPYRVAQRIVKDLQLSKTTLSDAHEQLSRLPLLDSLKMSIFQKFGNSPVRNTPSSAPVHIDSILSMLDLGESHDEPQQNTPQTPSDALISEIATAENTAVDFQKIQALISGVCNQIAEAIQHAPRFKSLAQSWYSLKNLLKLAGRNRSLHILVVSCPIEDCEENFQESLNFCSNNDSTPDIILWDYQYSIVSSSLQSLERIVNTADKYKSLLITSLDNDDLLSKDIHTTLPLRIIVERDEMIPYRRLRSSEACRSCVFGITPRYEMSDDNNFNQSNAAWLITAQWVYSVGESGTPFQWPTKIESLSGFTLSEAANFDRAKEISAYGFSLSQNPPQGYSVPPVVIMEIGEDSPYRSAGFNVLVNRTARLVVEWFSTIDATMSTDQKKQELHHFLITQLEPYHILSNYSSIQIEIKNGVATIDLNSDTTIDDCSVHFQFSVET